MTAVKPADPSPFRAETVPAGDGGIYRVERWLDRASEWLNPILVKEARQALKSRQFIVTFSLLLLCGWAWSLLGVAMLSPGVYFAPGGRIMLTGFLFILLVPMLVIVPFSAFRSLASEREDGTFELLSITSLCSRQIVTGKLGSAIIQMLVYYSALAPCIAFTYLLRGIDILTIALLLFYTFAISILLSSIGLLIATVSRSRHWQVLLSVTLVIALVVADFIASWVGGAVIWAAGPIEYDNVYFWLAQVAVMTFWASYLALFLLGAAAQISFASDNRSTKLRVILLAQQVLWVFWMTFLCVEARELGVLFAIIVVGGIHWYLAGSLMCGESAQLSPRVRRSLPHSFLGRMLGTWFNPGSGTGYVFVVTGVWSLALYAIAAAIVGELNGLGHSNDLLPKLVTVSTLIAAYVTAYLGVGRLITLLMRQVMHTGLVLPLLLHIALAVLGAFLPAVIGGWIQGFRDLDYSNLQVTNWVWTIIEAAEENLWVTPSVPIAIYSFAGLMLLTHFALAMREVEQTRLATPQRVVEDVEEEELESLALASLANRTLDAGASAGPR